MSQNNSTYRIEMEESTLSSQNSQTSLTDEQELLYHVQRANTQPNEELASFMGKLLQDFIAECIQTLEDPILAKVLNDEELQQFLSEKQFRFKNFLNFFKNQLINRYAEEFFGNLHWMKRQHKSNKFLTMAALMLLNEILLKEVRNKRRRLNL